MNTVAKRIRKDGLYRLLLPVLDQESLEKLLTALDPFYSMIEEGFDLKPHAEIKEDIVSATISAALGTAMPIRFISVKHFTQCDNSDEMRNKMNQCGLFSLRGLNEWGDMGISSSVNYNKLAYISHSCLISKLGELTETAFPNLEDYELENSTGTSQMANVLSHAADSLVLQCISAALKKNEDLLQKLSNLIALYPKMWLIGANEERSEWFVLCG